jgi:hypothetical protein
LNGVILAVSILGKDRISSKLMFTPTWIEHNYSYLLFVYRFYWCITWKSSLFKCSKYTIMYTSICTVRFLKFVCFHSVLMFRIVVGRVLI